MTTISITSAHSPTQLSIVRELLKEYGDILPALASTSDVCT